MNIYSFTDESLNSTGYTDWGHNEPDARRGEDCGVFGTFPTNIYGLGDFMCSVNLPYICEEETSARQKSIPTPQQQSPSVEGYEFISPLGYYKYHQYSATWQEAVDICTQDEGHLLIINSKQELMALTAFINRYRSAFNMWIAVHDKYKEGNFVTIFSKYCIFNMLVHFYETVAIIGCFKSRTT